MIRRLYHAGRAARRFRRGFTLLEAAIVTAIVGIGVVSIMELMAAGSLANGTSAELTTAMGLAGNIHERSLGVKYDDMFTTLDDKSYSPPVDAKGDLLNELTGWKQDVQVKYVDPDMPKSEVPDTQVEPVSRITVTISRNNRQVFSTSWLVSAMEWP